MIDLLSENTLVLETERLRLSPFRADDIDIAQAVLCNPEVMHFVADAMTPETVVQRMSDVVK